MARKIRVRGHRFSDAPAMYMRRTKFDRSHVYKTTFNAGKLIPVFVDEVLPGDTTRMSVNYFARLATPIKPIMDNIYLDWFFFFVPNRLVWEHWQNFCFEQEDPDDNTDYVIPTITATGNSENAYIGSLWDYFGLPVNTSDNISGINALPFRAVYLIWNEWFRDENLQKSVKIQKGDVNEVLDSSRSSDQPSWVFSSGTTIFAGLACPPRGKRHDYFTSAFPWTQKGPGVSIGLAGTAPIDLLDSATVVPNTVTDYFNQAGVSSLKTPPQGVNAMFNPFPENEDVRLDELFFYALDTLNLKKSVRIIIDDSLKENIICGDFYWLAEAIINILKNADNRKSCDKITISSEKNPLYTSLIIEDNGGGIEKENMKKIFKRFYKTPDSNGFGIGLAMAKTIVEKNNWEISVSNIDGGARFEIKFYNVT